MWPLIALFVGLAAGFTGGVRPIQNAVHSADHPIITEFMAANSNTLADEDGDFSDWIEIHNPTAAPVDLGGWALTDDADDPFRWIFPNTTLASGEYLVVFASGKDRRLESSYWNSIVQQGDSFRYFPGTEQPPDEWYDGSFDDSSWSESSSPLGYEKDPNGVQIQREVAEGLLSLYVRTEFTVDDPSEVLRMLLHVDYDDGFAAYINGEEVARRNVASDARFDTPADGLHEAVIYQGGTPEQFEIANPQSLLKAGTNVLAVVVHNANDTSSDLTISPFLMLETSEQLGSPRGVAAEIGSFGNRRLHTNFSLSRDGEYLALVNPSGEAITEFAPYPRQRADISYGLFGTTPTYFATPTPGAANQESLNGLLNPPTFSADHGLYRQPFPLYLFPEDDDGTIRYTTDGSQPSESNGTTYTDPIFINKTTVIRAASFKTTAAPSRSVTQTYLFLDDVLRQSAEGKRPPRWPASWGKNRVDYGMDPDVVQGREQDVIASLSAIPSFSIAMELDSLFNPVSGIYANALSYGREWERPASIELLYPDDQHDGGFQVNAGVRIRGGWSRNVENPKHAFRLFFRSEYGPSDLSYGVFGDEGTDEFDKIDLRTAQNYSWSYYGDARNTFLRDVFARDTQRDMDEPYTRSRYYHLYLNGQYWGLFQTQERADGSFGASYLGGDEDDFDVIKSAGLDDEYKMEATAGNVDAWRMLWEGANELAGEPDETKRDELYLRLQGLNPDGTRNSEFPVLLDPDNLINYMLVIFWTGNPDAPITPFMGTNNFFAIRNRTKDRGFTYFAHDSEHTLLPENGGYFDRTGPFRAGDKFQFSNPQWIHQQLMGSKEYRLRFADLARKHLFNGGALTTGEALARWDARAAEVKPALLAESARWGDAKVEKPRTMQDWEVENQRVRSTIIPPRTNVIIGQLAKTRRYASGKSDDPLVSAPLYPSVNAPKFNRHGGTAGAEFDLTMTAPSGGTIYYTLDGSDPRLFGGTVSEGAVTYDGTAVRLAGRKLVKARVYDGGEWSALTQAEFFVDTARPSATTLAISELYYHPTPPTADEDAAGFTSDEAFEFIELHSLSASKMDLAGLAFTDGIDLVFGEIVLNAGERAVVVADPDAFSYRFGSQPRVLATYSGRLSNGGESLSLNDADGSVILSFSYDDDGGWPARADGDGSSLELIDPQLDYRESSSWRASAEYNGSPGRAGAGPRHEVVINEVLTHTDEPDLDAIELYNAKAETIDIGGWLLTDAPSKRAFRIPAGTTVDAGAYLVFDESDFNASGTDADFALDGARGDEVWLIATDLSGAAEWFADHVVFGAARNGESFGRWPDATGALAPMRPSSLGAENGKPRAGEVILREIMYHPPGNNEYLEYIELANTGPESVSLAAWHLQDGVELAFDSTLVLGAGDSLLVVAFDPVLEPVKAATFRDAYGWPREMRMVGGWSGRLANEGETLTLTRPDEPPADDPSFIPQTIEERIDYGTAEPWPADAAGEGASLRRIGDGGFSGDPSAWRAQPRPLVMREVSIGPLPPYIPSSGFTLSAAYPNPAVASTNLTLAVREAQDVSITLYDVLGRRVRSVFSGMIDAERTYHIAIDGSELASGLYLMQIVGRDFSATSTVTFVR